MTTTTKNLLSILLLAFSLMFLFAATNMANSAEMSGDCHHCGTLSACNSGGQAYGYHNCEMVGDDCALHGNANCGIMGLP